MSAMAPASPPPAPITEYEATSANDNHPKLQLFLGGSCNPTTWRQKVAIPYLEMNGISYYNPQVDNWTPERVDSERFAKQNAQILLFVIDKQTRSTVSIVESAFMAGENKSLVLVIYPFEYNILSLTDTSKQSFNHIETSSRLKKTKMTSDSNELSSFTKSSSSSSSSTISSTLISSTSALAHQSNSTSTSTTASSTRTTLTSEEISSTSDDCLIDQKCMESKHEEKCSSTIILSGESISLREFRELEQARSILDKLVKMKKIPTFSDILQALKHVSHCLNAKKSTTSHSLPQITESVSTSSQRNELVSANSTCEELALVSADSNSSGEPLDQMPCAHVSDDSIKDIYLSLDSEDHTSMESMVISILEKKGLTYNFTSVNGLIETKTSSSTTTTTTTEAPVIVPKHFVESQSPTTVDHMTRYSSAVSLSDSSKLSIEKEICAIKSSRVLLFVITNKCRGLSIMVLASHFMALFRQNVVLCIQYLEEPCSIAGESLTKTAIADYNRGRVYLCDYASKSQVPVFSTIQEAIECCSRKCR